MVAGAGVAAAATDTAAAAKSSPALGHAALLQGAVDPPEGWLGHLPRSAAMQLPERHLGLVAAHELGQDAALARLDAAADLLAATPLGALTLDDWRARWAVAFAAPAAGDADAVPPLLAGRTVAVARDAAFAFIYPANVATLQALGARVVFFSPLAGDALPECDALWLPGGYPELHAAALAARSDLRSALHRHAADGKPIWAECGGMMALFEELVTADGAAHAMWGLLPGRTTMQKKLAGLGMQAWAAAADAPPLRGHSFHYSVCDTPLAPVGRTTPAPGSARREGEAEPEGRVPVVRHPVDLHVHAGEVFFDEGRGEGVETPVGDLALAAVDGAPREGSVFDVDRLAPAAERGPTATGQLWPCLAG